MDVKRRKDEGIYTSLKDLIELNFVVWLRDELTI